jgi:YjbE family integral membrane protein
MAEFGSVWNLLGILVEIVAINLVLSGDNAVVIALACRALPPRQQKQALILGSVGVVVMMTLLTACAEYLLSLPYVQLAGSLLLLWIGIKLLMPEPGGNHVKEGARLAQAVRTIIVADIVMSLDNVLGMAGAAEGHLGMLVVGLLITIPLILLCSAAIVKLFERFPVLITLGGGLLGYVAGEMAVGDPAIGGWVEIEAPYLHIVLPAAGAIIVVGLGKALCWYAGRAPAGAAESESGAE